MKSSSGFERTNVGYCEAMRRRETTNMTPTDPASRTGRTEISHLGVIIPARNEVELIGDTIRSVIAARACVGNVRVSIVVVADACVDDTAKTAERLISPGFDCVMVTDAGCAGAARRAGTNWYLRGVAGRASSVWLANTDADTTVPRTWLADQLELADAGYIATAGIVDLHPHRRAFPGLRRRFHQTYTIDTDGTHSHVHGANMGCWADAYLAAGGWRSMPVGEDHDLWDRLVVTGPTISTSLLHVDTDPRRHGRASDGFARDLDNLANTVSSTTTSTSPETGLVL